MTTQDLFEALKVGETARLRNLLKQATAEERSESVPKVLYEAIRRSPLPNVLALIEFCPDINDFPTRHVPPIYMSVIRGDGDRIQILQALIKAGADVNRESDGRDPIMFAVCRDDREAIRVLIEAGANINFSNDNGEMALSVARLRGKQDIIDDLQSAGATVPSGVETDLLLALTLSEADCAKRLIESGADVNAVRSDGVSALMLACRLREPLQICGCLLEHGADPDASIERDRIRGWNALKTAVEKRNVALVGLLLMHGADPNRVYRWDDETKPNVHYTNNGETSLMIAARFGVDEIVRCLLEHGADPNGRDLNGENVMDKAILSGSVEAVKLLLERGVRIEPDLHGQSCIRRLAHRLANAGRDTNQASIRNILQYLLSLPDVRDVPDFNEAFEVAASTADSEIVAAFLAAGAEPNTRRPDWPSVLQIAVIAGKAENVRLLLNAGAAIETRSDEIPTYERLISIAAKEGNHDVALVLVEYGLNPGNLLVEAAGQANVQLVRKLLDMGIDPNSRAEAYPHDTGLISCAASLSFVLKFESIAEIAEMLIAAGADVNATDIQGHTALIEAVNLATQSWDILDHEGSDYQEENNPSRNPRIVRLLLDSGANSEVVDSSGWSALEWAVECGGIELVEILAQAGTNVNAPFANGETAYNYATRHSNHALAELLTNFGAVEPEDVVGSIHRAILFNKTEAALRFIEQGADCKETNSDGLTPLMAACHYWGNVEIARVLIVEGANVDSRTESEYFNRDSALDFAVHKSAALVRLLLEAGADFRASEDLSSALMHALDHGYNIIAEDDRSPELYEIVELLLNAGADVNDRDWEGSTPMHLAVKGDNPSIVRLLLRHGANANVVTDSHDQACRASSPLIEAIRYGTNEIVQILLESGADVNLADQCGITPLMYACQPKFSRRPKGHSLRDGLVSQLLERGADVNAKDINGRTVLDNARSSNLSSIEELLLSRGAVGGDFGGTCFRVAFARASDDN